MSVPSPATQAPIKLKDVDVGYSYIEFPEDVFFMESLAQNEAFRAGVAYVPVQRYINGQEESHLYEITASPKSTVAKHVAGPITSPDGSRDITIFGSALSSTGMLFMCAFNRNSVIAFDLNKLPSDGTVKRMTCSLEIRNISSPNDVCIDPKDETVLYVVGGTFRTFCCCFSFSNSARGRVYKVKLAKKNKVSVHADRLNTLAGVEVIDDTLWVAQLFDIIKKDQTSTAVKQKPTVAWRGLDAQNQFWLADNIDTFVGDNNNRDKLMCPAYSTAPAGAVKNVMNRSCLVSAVVIFLQLSTACMRRERFRTALRDPEVSLAFSNTYIKTGVDPAPLRLIFLDTATSGGEIKNHNAVHFEIDLEDTRAQNEAREVKSRDGSKVLGRRDFFNEQVTHAAHFRDGSGAGFVACVNFEQPRILLLNDKVFRDGTSRKAVVE